MISMLECDNNSNGNSNNKRQRQRMMSKKVDKRRFRSEQIEYLDLIFESERKLDPRKKAEVARKLDLQPRQVAIWFQNKRARWKAKHIHNEYSLLLSNYNNLSARFHSLNEHNQSLRIQLENLKKEMRGKENEEWEGGGERNGGGSSSSDGESESNKMEELQVKNDGVVSVSVSASDDDSSNIPPLLNIQNSINININADDDDDDELLRMADWGTLDSDDIIINQSTSQWWGFWS